MDLGLFIIYDRPVITILCFAHNYPCLFQFGISLLCCMIKAGEDYFEKTSPVDIDNQLKTKW